MSKSEPIALVHWGDPSKEDEEIDEIKLLLEATLFGGDLDQQGANAPQMADLRIADSRLDKLQEILSQFLSDHTNVQILFFSAHGNATGLGFNRTGNPMIAYADFGNLLTSSLRHTDCIHLVLGSCEAMAPSVEVEKYMPRAIYAVSGFTCSPLSSDVAALMASIVQDDVSLYQKLSCRNVILHMEDGKPARNISDVITEWKGILETHKEDPVREVQGNSGVAVVTATRDEKTGTWSRRTIDV